MAGVFFFLSFLVLLWLLSLSVACCYLDVRAAYTAVYDRYSFQSAFFLFFLPGLPTTCCCECSRRPWGMCLCLLPPGACSHISSPPRASIGIELAFTQSWRKLRAGAETDPQGWREQSRFLRDCAMLRSLTPKILVPTSLKWWALLVVCLPDYPGVTL